jgi:hypothetical protein
MESTKVLAKLFLPFRPNIFEVLISEDDDTPLSD